MSGPTHTLTQKLSQSLKTRIWIQIRIDTPGAVLWNNSQKIFLIRLWQCFKC